MIMRYHPSLAVGHTYHKYTSDSDSSAANPTPATKNNNSNLDDQREILDADSKSIASSNTTSMDSMDRDPWEDEIESQNSAESGNDEDDSKFIELYEMYG